MYEDMLLAEMEIRYRFGVVVQLNAVHFVYNNGNGAMRNRQWAAQT